MEIQLSTGRHVADTCVLAVPDSKDVLVGKDL